MSFARKLLMNKVDRSKNTWFLFCEIFIKSKGHSKNSISLCCLLIWLWLRSVNECPIKVIIIFCSGGMIKKVPYRLICQKQLRYIASILKSSSFAIQRIYSSTINILKKKLGVCNIIFYFVNLRGVKHRYRRLSPISNNDYQSGKALPHPS